jgi:hypothetical protein
MLEVTYDALQKRVAALEAILREKVFEIETASKQAGHCTECHWAVRAWDSKEHRDDCWYVKAHKAVAAPCGNVFHGNTVTKTGAQKPSTIAENEGPQHRSLVEDVNPEMVLVPAEPTDEMLEAMTDADGDRIFESGTEYYFRDQADALWFGRQVWAAMVRQGEKE